MESVNKKCLLFGFMVLTLVLGGALWHQTHKSERWSENTKSTILLPRDLQEIGGIQAEYLVLMNVSNTISTGMKNEPDTKIRLELIKSWTEGINRALISLHLRCKRVIASNSSIRLRARLLAVILKSGKLMEDRIKFYSALKTGSKLEINRTQKILERSERDFNVGRFIEVDFIEEESSSEYRSFVFKRMAQIVKVGR